MNIIETLRERTHTSPDRAALVAWARNDKRSLSFRELDHASARAAAMLETAGLREGDAVLVFLPMSIDLYLALLAIFRSNLTAMFIDPHAGQELLDTCCRLYPPKGFIGVPLAHGLRLKSRAIRQIPIKFSTGLRLPATRRWGTWKDYPIRDDGPCQDDAAALVTFTSGITGQPKVAVRSHGFLRAQHDVLAQELAYDSEDRVLTTLPIFVLSHMGCGVTSVIPDADIRRPGSVDPVPIVRQLLEETATGIEAPPAFLDRITRHCRALGIRFPALRKIFTGGGPVFPALLDQLEEIAPNATVIALYGSTEAEPIAHIARDRIDSGDAGAMTAGGGLLTGEPVKRIQLRIIQDQWTSPIGPFSANEFEAQCLPADAVGEIVVSGSHVLLGYHGGVGEHETKFRVDDTVWHRTGDAGYLDQRGRLWLMGRCSARIQDDRGELYPFAVECAAYQHPGLRRAACVSRGGKRLLVVQREPDAGAVSLDDLRSRLGWASIDKVIVVPEIPMDKRHNSKIDYHALDRVVSGLDVG